MTEDLDKKKVCAHFVPPNLKDDEKLNRVDRSRDISTAENDSNFLKSIVIENETNDASNAIEKMLFNDVDTIQTAVTRTLKTISRGAYPRIPITFEPPNVYKLGRILF